MPRVTVNSPAPDFELQDLNENTIRLRDFKGRSHVFLVFNRGFI